MRCNATAAVPEFVASHSPCSRGSTGTELPKSQNAALSKTEKTMPANAADLGVRSCARVSVSAYWDMFESFLLREGESRVMVNSYKHIF